MKRIETYSPAMAHLVDVVKKLITRFSELQQKHQALRRRVDKLEQENRLLQKKQQQAAEQIYQLVNNIKHQQGQE